MPWEFPAPVCIIGTTSKEQCNRLRLCAPNRVYSTGQADNARKDVKIGLFEGKIGRFCRGHTSTMIISGPLLQKDTAGSLNVLSAMQMAIWKGPTTASQSQCSGSCSYYLGF